MTDTDCDNVAGVEDPDIHKRYLSISRVRNRINEELARDVEILEEHHSELLEELKDVVCLETDGENAD
ncbi:hypothetical protein [Halohasta litorea]|uniref:Uncharacterized protein n=1 Tax=Halohasta litorea TaxID=869891 RepID=A0ABD6DBK0_9EURY|nr:hypothetical protein [Halohasta litorea]